MGGPLTGRRIIDISERSAAALIAGMMLSDLGAEVIRIEPEGGDPVRALDGCRTWLRGQQSVIVTDAQLADGSWQALRASADVILDTAQPWTDKPAGLLQGWTEEGGQVLAILTALPQAARDAFERPREEQPPAYGELVEAQYDMMVMQGGYRAGPIFLGWPMAVHGAAWLLVSGILAGLHAVSAAGRGQVLTCSLLEGALAMSPGQWWGNSLPQSPPALPALAQPSLSLLECADQRYIYLFMLTRDTFDRVVAVIGRDFGIDPKISLMSLSKVPAQYMALRDQLQEEISKHPADYWCEVFGRADVPCVIAHSPGGAYAIEQPIVNGLVTSDEAGPRQFGMMGKFSRTPLAIRHQVPAAGQSAGALARQPVTPKGAGAGRTGQGWAPLEGLLVLDVGAFIAGPYSSKIYADLGARVIKIEELTGEKMRHAGDKFYPFSPSNRGKESIALDLKTAQGRAILHALVRKADIVHHNMREQALTRLEIDYATLSAINPRLIYCHSTGFGNDGPWARNPSFEYLQSAFAGMLHRTGGSGNVPAQYLGNMDWGQGLLGAALVLAALDERRSSGQGQFIEVPHTAAAMLAMSDVAVDGATVHETYRLDGAQRGHAPTNALYQAADGWVLISCHAEREWAGVGRAVGLEAGWPTYAATRQTMVDQDHSALALSDAVRGLTALELRRRLEAQGVPCMIVAPYHRHRLAGDAHLRALGVTTVSHIAGVGTYWELGNLVRFAQADKLQAVPAPRLGAHSAGILRELGKTDAEIEALVASKVLVLDSAAA